MAGYLDEMRRGLERAPDEIAIVCGSRMLTRGYVRSQVFRLARALKSRGLCTGDGLTCLIGDTPEALLIRLTANILGCRFTGLTPYFGISTTKSVLADSAPAALVIDPALNRYAGALLNGQDVPDVLTLGAAQIGEDLFALAEGQPDEPPPNTVGEDDLAQVSYTSGTTGRPKGVANSFGQLADFVTSSRMVFGTGPRRLLVTNPVAYLGGDTALWTLVDGGAVVLHNNSSPTSEILADVEVHRVSHLLVSPSQLYRLAATADKYDLSSIRRIVYGGAPAVATRTAEALLKFGPVLYQTYAERETGFITGLDVEAHRRPELLDSVGRPLPGVDIVIRDRNGRPVPPGEVGEITVRSGSVMSGYWNAPDPSDAVMRNGWLQTGDLGRQDSRGWLYVVDRIKDVVLIDGFTVYSRPVEDALNSHPSVRQAIVISIPHEATGEALHAAVVRQPATELSIDDLQDFVGARLGGMCVPTSVDFIDDIPVTAAGKPDKKALRERLVQR